MEQLARNATIEGTGYLNPVGTYCMIGTRSSAVSSGGRWLREARNAALTARSPNLNSYAEFWVRSVKEECLD